jgi:hypothetical protein
MSFYLLKKGLVVVKLIRADHRHGQDGLSARSAKTKLLVRTAFPVIKPEYRCKWIIAREAL